MKGIKRRLSIIGLFPLMGITAIAETITLAFLVEWIATGKFYILSTKVFDKLDSLMQQLD